MYEYAAAAMDTAVVSLRSRDISALAPSRTKRKWADDGDAASNSSTTTSAARSRARVNGYETRKSIQLACPARTDAAYVLSSSTGSASAATEIQPALSSPRRGVPVPAMPVTIPQTQPQTYPDSQLHSTYNPSGHSSVAQDCCARTIFCHDNDTMPIAYTEAPAYSRYSTTSAPSATYNPHFQQNHWPAQGQPGDALGQSHTPQVPSSSPPQSVSLQLIQANGAVYPAHPPVFVLNQSLVYGPGLVQHNFQQQPYIPPHHFQQFLRYQGTEQLPIQAPQGYHYGYHYSGPGPQYPPYISADTRRPGYSVPDMGGGSHIPPGHQQAPVNYHFAQPPIRQIQTIPTMDTTHYTEPEATTSRAVHAQDDTSYEQHTHMAESADWQRPVNLVSGEGHEADGEFEEGMSDASGISDPMDIHCDVHDDFEGQEGSQGTGEGEQESAPSSSIKEEDASASSVPKPKRGQLSPAHRKQTAETRKIKACTRCRMQKMRCYPDPADPTGDCVGCKTFSKTSKKTIHRMPCYRGKITDAILFRSGGLELTKRWKGAEMKDVGDRPRPKDIRTILFTLGICKEQIEVKVVAFEPQSGDVTARFWMDGEQGVRKKKELASYCLANIQKTASYFEDYIKRNAVEVLWNERAGGDDQPRDILEQTYAYVIRRFQLLRRKPALPGREERELNILGNLFILWFAMRHSTGSSWIQGKETLGMKPETRDDTYPLYKRVSVPRMILAQFDSINYTRILSKYGKFVLSELESLMSRNQPEYFFLVYACLFILLREASWMSADRYRHARHNHGQSVRYSIPQFVENLHDSCNNLLQHWHYYNAKAWPKPTEAGDRFKTPLALIDADEYNLMMQALTDPAVQRQLDVWRRYKAENGHLSQPNSSNVGGRPYEGRQVFYDWDHPFYWISQLFEENWQPHATYRAERIDPLAM